MTNESNEEVIIYAEIDKLPKIPEVIEPQHFTAETHEADPNLLKPHPVSAALYCGLPPGDQRIITPLVAANLVMQNTYVGDILKSFTRKGIKGIDVPLVITEHGIIISGCRRWKAALTFGMTSVPVEVKSYKNELEEKQAILDYNISREKIKSQIMREAELYKEIAGKLARTRMLAGRRDPTPMLAQGSKHQGETNTVVGSKFAMGKETFRKMEHIWQQAEHGDPKAAQLVDDIDNDIISINGAFNKLNKINSSSEAELIKKQRAEPVGNGLICPCLHCAKRYRLVHFDNGEHKHLEMGEAETE